jgi:hypothetical protein
MGKEGPSKTMFGKATESLEMKARKAVPGPG